ncbi:Gfo/Idh/MocA family oxidoreductase [Antrihabitans sp. YC2-6]|uniref:Gfo/Idh/MocA family oxidoreductase n=1 Tax=Antrihabitans sp. YC2-6 TaxID=2799498 RepID=UPI0018F7B1EB|nr:Gfo/Idh/MocA family oxidoreductase [Antrihabitans sp. YC2-6]MBJ8344767.1 Gfo/Idh/MocA family oxidoreductase [Antrihabitans sp. YC2-6]
MTLRVGMIGAGWIGRFHAETLAQRLPDTELVAIADPIPPAAEILSSRLNVRRTYLDPAELISDPAVQAVAICAPATSHADLVVAAAEAGKHVFCEKPMALTIADADRAIAAAHDAGVILQVGFNRRFDAGFAAAERAIRAGEIGTPQLLRSLTRDPGMSVDTAARVKPWTIFNETLIHDFDALRFLNPDARVVEVFAQADALIHPQYKDRGLLDTAMVQLRFDNGAFAVAEASFSATYGYDIRGEVFGSDGMVTAGELMQTSMRRYGAGGLCIETPRLNIELFHDAYVAQFAHFADCILAGRPPAVNGADAKAALEIALAARESVETGAPVRLAAVAA